jgi:tRNA (guanine-N7-)-methyltransferase
MRVRRSVPAPPLVEGGILLNLQERTPPLDWRSVFPVPVESVEIEIGSGKGMFLQRSSAERPDVGFLGVERAGKWLALCVARVTRDDRQNVRLTRADAFDLLARWVPLGSAATIHVYFPDPWPKKRHAKRRLLSPSLYDLAARALRTGGCLAIATDVDWYFAEAAEVLDAHRCFERLPDDPGFEASVRTHYARKYEHQGRTCRFIRYERNGSAAPPLPPPPSRLRKPASTVPPLAS